MISFKTLNPGGEREQAHSHPVPAMSHCAQAATLTAAQKGDPPMRERERTLLESERDRFEDMLRGITVGEGCTFQEGKRREDATPLGG